MVLCAEITKLRAEHAEREAKRDAENAEREARRDAEIVELRAEFAALKKAGNEPDTDGRINIKRAAEKLGCSDETVRRRCAEGKIDAAKDRGQWRVRIP